MSLHDERNPILIFSTKLIIKIPLRWPSQITRESRQRKEANKGLKEIPGHMKPVYDPRGITEAHDGIVILLASISLYYISPSACWWTVFIIKQLFQCNISDLLLVLQSWFINIYCLVRTKGIRVATKFLYTTDHVGHILHIAIEEMMCTSYRIFHKKKEETAKYNITYHTCIFDYTICFVKHTILCVLCNITVGLNSMKETLLKSCWYGYL